MNRTSRLGSSLKNWLQSTALLAVLAGYSVLLLANQRLAEWQRLEGFRQSTTELLSTLGRRAADPGELQELLLKQTVAGMAARITRARPRPEAMNVTMVADQGYHWLLGDVPLDLVDGTRVFLQVRQNVTVSVQQERLTFWGLVVAAGGSSLLTSLLLRLVLNRGLVQPLEEFNAQLQGLALPPTPAEVVSVQDQPQELQPIAASFNALQQRLTSSWDRQRVFTDGVAHELRTPITLISGHAQSLLRQSPPATMTASLQLIRSEAERMTSLVSDLLDLARHDAQRLVLKRQAIHADDVLLQLFERLSAQTGYRLQLEAGPGNTPPPPPGMGDPDRIQQCLTALVDNALNYSPPESPISLGSSRAGDGSLVLHVGDVGPGVPMAERERIFERFVRGEAAAGGTVRGSGIGLAMVQLLMVAMGGRVEVADAAGGGADFQLHLPAFNPAEAPASA